MDDGTEPSLTRYRLLLEAMRSDVPAPKRLALALKILKRTCEFRCIEVNEVTDGDQDLDDRPDESG